MQLVDAHVHHWALARGDYGWLVPALGPLYRDYGAAEFQPVRRAAGVDRIVLIQAAPTDAETAYLLSLAEQKDYILGVVGWLDFDADDAAQRVATLARHSRIVGLRPMIQDISATNWMLRPQLTTAFEALERACLTFDALVMPRHLKPLHRLAKRHPGLKIVIDHGAKPSIADCELEPWRTEIAACAALPNLWCKLSGLITQAGPDWTAENLRPYVEHLLEVFGPHRLIWGSDWPVLNLTGDYAGWFAASQLLLASLGPAQQRQVFCDNALIAYGAAR